MHSSKSFAVIEFPGVLRNPQDPRNAITALGGEEPVCTKIAFPFAENVPPLNLNLRPGTGTSNSNIMADKTLSPTTLFVLSVTEVISNSPSRQQHPDNSDIDSKPDARQLDSQHRNSPHILSISDTPQMPEKDGHNPHIDLEPDAPELQVQHDNNPDGHVALNKRATEAKSHFTATLVGQVTSLTRFQSLADFQYHPCKPSGSNSQNLQSLARNQPTPRIKRPLEVAGDSLFHVLKDFQKRSRVDDIEKQIDRLRPICFVRPRRNYGDMDYWFRQFCTNAEGAHVSPSSLPLEGRGLVQDRRSDTKRLDALYHRVAIDADQIPSRPHPSVHPPLHRGRDSFRKLFKVIDGLFQARPIWIRRALFEGIPTNLRKSFKKVIMLIAYSFQGPGPFYQAWIRYGYDPRKHPDARQYQVVEFRCNHPVVVEAVRRKKNELVGHDDKNFSDEFQMPDVFTLTDLPLRRNNLMQLCDIKIASAIDFCHTEQPLQEFHNKFGFFSEAGYNKLIKVIRTSLARTATEVIGTKRAAQMILDYRMTKDKDTDSLRRKRKRVSILDIVKRDVSTEVEQAVDVAEKEAEGVKGSFVLIQPRIQSPMSAQGGEMGGEISGEEAKYGEGLAVSDMGKANYDLSEETSSKGANEQDTIGTMGAECVEGVIGLADLENVEAFEILGDDDEDFENDSEDFGDEEFEDEDSEEEDEQIGYAVGSNGNEAGNVVGRSNGGGAVDDVNVDNEVVDGGENEEIEDLDEDDVEEDVDEGDELDKMDEGNESEASESSDEIEEDGKAIDVVDGGEIEVNSDSSGEFGDI